MQATEMQAPTGSLRAEKARFDFAADRAATGDYAKPDATRHNRGAGAANPSRFRLSCDSSEVIATPLARVREADRGSTSGPRAATMRPLDTAATRGP
jgi:hypothetical protein